MSYIPIKITIKWQEQTFTVLKMKSNILQINDCTGNNTNHICRKLVDSI